MNSLVQENYLKSLYMLADSSTRVRTSKLSHYINTSIASVSDMLQKLESKDFVHYTKYKGASLSEKGLQTALEIIRRHRLWEVFLHKKLGFTGDEVHALAEELEHVRDPVLIDRLDAYLGRPMHDPHGASIPTAEGSVAKDRRHLLSSLEVGARGVVLSFRQQRPRLLDYLNRLGLAIGDRVEVKEIEPYDGSIRISVCEAKLMSTISRKAADNIYIST